MIVVEGVRFFPYFETTRPMAEHVQCIRNLPMRSDDVLICAFKKAGTHWLWEVTSMLLTGSVEYQRRSKEFAMMEVVPIEQIQDQPSPRALNTHLPVSMLPAQVVTNKVKVIHVYRNVKDVVLSLYNHVRQNAGKENITIDDVLPLVIGDEPDSFASYHRDMDKFIRDNPEVPVFRVSFEEMKKDSQDVVRRLGQFLGVTTTDQLSAEIAEATKFANLKAADVHKTKVEHLPRRQFYHKGNVGEWKNHLTVAQSELLDDAVKSLQDCDYSFRYSL